MTAPAIATRDEQVEVPRAPVHERSMVPLEGEKRLMLAVLERAVDDFRAYADVPTGRGRWLFMGVAAWFDSSETGPFDFEGICQATGLDPDFIRKGLRTDNVRRCIGVSGSKGITESSAPARVR